MSEGYSHALSADETNRKTGAKSSDGIGDFCIKTARGCIHPTRLRVPSC